MTKVIIISGGNLDSFYEQTLQYLHDKYHSYPSSLSGSSMSETEAAELGQNEAQAKRHGRGGGDDDDLVPIGKRVI